MHRFDELLAAAAIADCRAKPFCLPCQTKPATVTVVPLPHSFQQVKDMAAKTEETVAVDSLVDTLKQLLAAAPQPAAAAAAAGDGAAAAAGAVAAAAGASEASS